VIGALTRRQFGALCAAAWPAGTCPAQARGIVRVTRSPARLVSPASTPEGSTWRYGVGPTFQVAPRLAGMFCNIRMEYAPGTDFEAGNDVVLFGDLARLGSARALPVSRNHREPNPNSRPPGEASVMVKYWIRGGFVPFGARRPDGSPHPHAGTGFGLCQAVSWPLDDRRSEQTPGLGSRRAFAGAESYQYLELQQYRYDGGEFRVLSTTRAAYGELLEGWVLSNPAMRNAIAAGDDLLLGISGNAARVQSASSSYGLGCGVSRWRRTGDGWRPVSFVQVTDDRGWFEPSLIRDLDGTLLLSARGASPATMNSISVWRSKDEDATWSQVIDLPGSISQAPVSLNQAADGTPYLVANPYEILSVPRAKVFPLPRDPAGRPRLGGWLRENLYLWPLTLDRTGVEAPLRIRECRSEFGPPPHGSTWNVDHPTGMTLQLADGRWRHLLTERILEYAELRGFGPTPATGLYVEEVVSAGEPLPTWRF
jgi:hypothetical protein